MKILTSSIGIAFLISILISSCSNDQGTCLIQGELKDSKGSPFLYLRDMDTYVIVDSFQVKNGVIDHGFTLDHPKYFILHNRRAQYEVRDRKHIWLDPSNIQLSGSMEFLGNIEVVGSRSNKAFYVYKEHKDSVDNQIMALDEEFAINGDPNRHLKRKALYDSLKAVNYPDLSMYFLEHPELFNTSKQNQIVARIDSINVELSSWKLKFLLENSNSYVALSILHNECYLNNRVLEKEEIITVFDHLTNELKKTDKGNEVAKYLNLPDVPQVGDRAIDFAQQTPEGDTVRLSDFSGMYLLVDFWASNCGPCRGKNPELRKLYSLYHSSGLEILGVSGDVHKSDWVTAISSDSLNWANVSDLNGWYNEAFLLYDIKQIPYMLVIDRDGSIVLKTRNWIQIEEQFAKVFN